MVVNAAQLVTYAQTKQSLLSTGKLNQIFDTIFIFLFDHLIMIMDFLHFESILRTSFLKYPLKSSISLTRLKANQIQEDE